MTNDPLEVVPPDFLGVLATAKAEQAHMNKIALNFVPLIEQNKHVTVYRTKVSDSSRPVIDGDFRAKLPGKKGDNDWVFFDVSTIARTGYKQYEYEYPQNPYLTVHLIYQDFLGILNAGVSELEHYVPEKTIFLKNVHFITSKYDEGNSEIIVSPYYLKEKRAFGFLIDHKFSLKDNQPFNRDAQIRSFSLDKSGRQNVFFYKDKKLIIEAFKKNVLSPLLSNSRLNFSFEFSSLPANLLNVKTYLVGDKKAVKSQFMGIKHNGPYRRMNDEVRYLFIFTEHTKSLAREIYLGLTGKLFPGQFSGLEEMFSIPIYKEIVDHHIVDTFDANALQTIVGRIQQSKEFYPNSKVMLVAVLPKGSKGADSSFDVYGNLKLVALRNNTYCQVVTEDTFFRKDQLKWSISNIGLQIFCKLGGAPWLVKSAKNNCLVFGLGSVHEKILDKTTRYTAYTICLDSSGDFKCIKPLSRSSDEQDYLEHLKTNLKAVLLSDLGDQYKSIVLHLPRKISRKEINVVKTVVSEIRGADDIEVIVIRINTKHKFLGFGDHNTCVPYESSYVKLSKNEFLVWAEGLQYGKEVLHRRVSEPLYVEFIEVQEDSVTKEEFLQEILNLTGANWRGFNSKAQPISILYSRLIAKFMKEFSHLEAVEDMSIVSAESAAPWFL